MYRRDDDAVLPEQDELERATPLGTPQGGAWIPPAKRRLSTPPPQERSEPKAVDQAALRREALAMLSDLSLD